MQRRQAKRAVIQKKLLNTLRVQSAYFCYRQPNFYGIFNVAELSKTEYAASLFVYQSLADIDTRINTEGLFEAPK